MEKTEELLPYGHEYGIKKVGKERFSAKRRTKIGKLNFKNQLTLGVVILMAGFVCATVMKIAVCANIGWIIYGLLFVIHPVARAREKPQNGAVYAPGGCDYHSAGPCRPVRRLTGTDSLQ